MKTKNKLASKNKLWACENCRSVFYVIKPIGCDTCGCDTFVEVDMKVDKDELETT